MLRNILQIAPTPFFSDRGCHIRIEGVVRCLNQSGYRNTVCTYHHGRDVPGIKTVRIGNIKNYTQTEAGPSRYKLWADLKLLWLCLVQYNRQRPKVIHAHLHEGLFIGLIVKYFFFWHKTPIIADLQGSLSGELSEHGIFKKYPWLREPTRNLEYKLMHKADHIVCSSEHSMTKFINEFDIPEEKISLAQDGADLSPTYSEEQKDALRNQLGLPENKTIVVYSGALLENKGLKQLKSLVMGCSRYTNTHFLIIGYPIENIVPFLIDNKLAEHCTVTGRVEFEELPKYLSLADLAIDPKFSDAGEGSGKMLNYLASGLPVAAFDTANNKSFLPEGTILASTTEELIELTKRMDGDATFRSTKGKLNLEHFVENYSWKFTRIQLGDAYRKVL